MTNKKLVDVLRDNVAEFNANQLAKELRDTNNVYEYIVALMTKYASDGQTSYSTNRRALFGIGETADIFKVVDMLIAGGVKAEYDIDTDILLTDWSVDKNEQ